MARAEMSSSAPLAGGVDGPATPLRRGDTVLLTGATGFVGRHLHGALEAAGYRVRCGSRDPARAAASRADQDWVRFDLADPATVDSALAGCQGAIYLVHGMGGQHQDYPAQERAAAHVFRRAAERAGVKRIVYLGGVAPQGRPSRHLSSRLETGSILRAGRVSTMELRAAMVIGAGSAGWQIVRDLASRLPVMILPRWLQSHSWPVGIHDVVAALLLALRCESAESAWFDVPGPERLSHKHLLRRVTAHMGRHPLMLDVPVLSPRLSSYWLGLVTRANLSLARELVQGLRHDMDPTGRRVWELDPQRELQPIGAAVTQALEDERCAQSPGPATRARLAQLGRSLAPHS
jgi:uncharacterized protein YbjT (DUF2867 family)